MREIGGAAVQDLPILALTAKAMKGDRRKVPGRRRVGLHRQAVNSDQLLSLLRVWLNH
jgi:CheY-like chemotaxis protein